MNRIGLIFPGQGSQYPGMGLEVYNEIKDAKQLLDKANDILEFDIKSIIFGNSAIKLLPTEVAQPAIFLVSAMYLEKFKLRGENYEVVAGHSLGEYTALYAAGVLPFEDALRLVRRRGLLMAESSNENGGMAAIMGMDIEQLEDLINNYNQDAVIANINSINQIVISGKLDILKEIVKYLEEKATVSAKLLNVSGAFHSPYMQKAKMGLKHEIDNIKFSEPNINIVPNVLGKPTKDREKIKECLVEQMTGQVRWLDTILSMKAIGIDKLYEVGPGDVLKKLNSTITYKLKCDSLDNQ